MVTVIFLLNLLIAQLNCSYATTYQDMLGYARLNRGKIVTEVCTLYYVPMYNIPCTMHYGLCTIYYVCYAYYVYCVRCTMYCTGLGHGVSGGRALAEVHRLSAA